MCFAVDPSASEKSAPGVSVHYHICSAFYGVCLGYDVLTWAAGINPVGRCMAESLTYLPDDATD
eukprot:602855-Amphidinium_carterae.1